MNGFMFSAPTRFVPILKRLAIGPKGRIGDFPVPFLATADGGNFVGLDHFMWTDMERDVR